MLRWIIGSSLKFRFIVVLAAAALVAVGIWRLRDMPIDAFPEFAPPLVEIQTEGQGMSSTEVEEMITIPLEESLKGTPELDVMRSKSVIGLSSIVLIFKRGTDIFHARQLVQERLQLALPALPTSAYPPIVLQPLSATSRCMKIGLTEFAEGEGSLDIGCRFRPKRFGVSSPAFIDLVVAAHPITSPYFFDASAYLTTYHVPGAQKLRPCNDRRISTAGDHRTAPREQRVSPRGGPSYFSRREALSD